MTKPREEKMLLAFIDRYTDKREAEGGKRNTIATYRNARDRLADALFLEGRFLLDAFEAFAKTPSFLHTSIGSEPDFRPRSKSNASRIWRGSIGRSAPRAKPIRAGGDSSENHTNDVQERPYDQSAQGGRDW